MAIKRNGRQVKEWSENSFLSCLGHNTKLCVQTQHHTPLVISEGEGAERNCKEMFLKKSNKSYSNAKCMDYKEHKEMCALRSFIARSPLLRKDRKTLM